MTLQNIIYLFEEHTKDKQIIFSHTDCDSTLRSILALDKSINKTLNNVDVDGNDDLDYTISDVLNDVNEIVIKASDQLDECQRRIDTLDNFMYTLLYYIEEKLDDEERELINSRITEEKLKS